MYCMKCGKELQDGVPCVCTQIKNEENQEVVNENPTPQPETPKKEKKGTFTNFLKNFGLIFVKPGEAIKDAVANNRWVNGVIYVIIFSVIMGISGTISSVGDSLTYYNSAVDRAQENYDSAKISFALNASYYNSRRVEIAENALDIAKENRLKRITSFDFIFGLVGRFVQNFITPVLSVGIISLLLLLVGKMFKGTGTFTGVLAGVGLANNLGYLSKIILPLLANIPVLEYVFSAARTGIAAVFGILLFVVVKESFEVDDSKSAWAVFFALSVATLISTLILLI